MTPPTAAERSLYRDINRLMQAMRGDSLAAVEAAIEARVRRYVQSEAAGAVGELAITHTLSVHDDGEPWTMTRTEYRLATRPAAGDAAVAGDAPAVRSAGRLEAVATAADAATDVGAGSEADLGLDDASPFANVVPFPRAFRARRSVVAAPADRRPSSGG